MIELTWEQITRADFKDALAHLYTNRGLNFKTSYHSGRVIDLILSQLREYELEHQKYLKKFCELDESGKPKRFLESDGSELADGVEAKGPWAMKIVKEKEDAAKQEFEELMGKKFSIDKTKLSVSQLEGAQLSPQNILALESILDLGELDEKESNQEKSGEEAS